MKDKIEEINYNYINNLYMAWVNESNPFLQREKKEKIKNNVSPQDLLIYSTTHATPFKAFLDIFSMTDLFATLEEMQKIGKNLQEYTNHQLFLLIQTPEDIKEVSNFVQKDSSLDLNNISFSFIGDNVFKYGDVKNIGKKFPNAYVNNVDIEQIELMFNSKKDYKGIPIVINIDNIGQLPLEKLSIIENLFDVDAVKIQSREQENVYHQGECTPLNLNTYKEIRTVVDEEFIHKLYINKDFDKMHIDYQLAIQIIDKIANKIEYDFEAAKSPRFSIESRNASSLVGLLTGKSICKGYSEIVRNVLSCVGIECKAIDGIALKGEEHAWNQVKIGDTWYNIDVTFARDKICEGKPSGDLFMSDAAFFENRKQVTLAQGSNLECKVIIGGHIRALGTNSKTCPGYIPPVGTATLMQESRFYEVNYRRFRGCEGYQGVVPYVGSIIEKSRFDSKIMKEEHVKS